MAFMSHHGICFQKIIKHSIPKCNKKYFYSRTCKENHSQGFINKDLPVFLVSSGPQRALFGAVLVAQWCPTGTSWTVACQAPLSMELYRQEYWSGLPFLFSRILLNKGSNPGLLYCRQILYCLSHQGSPGYVYFTAI